MARGVYRRKTVRYRVNGPVDLLAHTEHWRGFTFSAGPVMVKYVGPWGQIQVWASSEGEARRVIGHAMAIAGWGDVPPEETEWVMSVSSGSRNGKGGTCVLRPTVDGWSVTAREGPNGPTRFHPYTDSVEGL